MIKFLVDSASDYEKTETEKKGILRIPITITLKDKNILDGEITKDEFYQLVQNADELPKTSQPSPQDFLDVFEKAKENDDELICILLSSKLSGTLQSATLAKSMAGYDKIHIIDSLSATYVIKMMTEYGIQLRDSGKNALEIVDELEKMKSKIKLYAVLDTLENLKKGGRLSTVEAGIGTLAKIKPLVTLTEDGKVGMKGKSIGRKKALADIVKLVEKENINTNYPIYNIYSYGMDNNKLFLDKLNEIGIALDESLQIGPTIGTHIGPGAYGIIFVKNNC